MKVSKVTFEQESDSCSMGIQEIEIIRKDAGAGDYFVIKTDEWAFDNIQELIDLFTKVQFD